MCDRRYCETMPWLSQRPLKVQSIKEKSDSSCLFLLYLGVSTDWAAQSWGTNTKDAHHRNFAMDHGPILIFLLYELLNTF